MQLIHDDCLNAMKSIPDKSVDLVLCDPPYLYTKCEFDKKVFDEKSFFAECYRVLKDNSIICFTGYSDSFYRWNMICADLGFKFKEEWTWNKKGVASPFNAVGRVSEQISVREKGNRKLNKLFINLVKETFEAESAESFEHLTQICKRINSLFNTKFDLAEQFIKYKNVFYNQKNNGKFNVATPKCFHKQDRGISSLQTFVNGTIQKSIFNISRDSVKKNVHPTQKPVELFERLIKICSDEKCVVLDPFMGSGTTGVACVNTNRDFIGIEKEQKYFDIAQKRIKEAQDSFGLFEDMKKEAVVKDNYKQGDLF